MPSYWQLFLIFSPQQAQPTKYDKVTFSSLLKVTDIYLFTPENILDQQEVW